MREDERALAPSIIVIKHYCCILKDELQTIIFLKTVSKKNIDSLKEKIREKIQKRIIKYL